MKEYAFTVNLKDDPGVVSRYEEHHANIWPEVVIGLKRHGVEDVKIWRLGCRLFMLVRTVDSFDPEEFSRLYRASHPRVAEWEELMAGFQERVPEADGGGTWAEMKEIFKLVK